MYLLSELIGSAGMILGCTYVFSRFTDGSRTQGSVFDLRIKLGRGAIVIGYRFFYNPGLRLFTQFWLVVTLCHDGGSVV